MTTALLVKTNGSYASPSVVSYDEFAQILGSEHVDCVTFTTGIGSSISVWVDDEGAANHEANVVGTIIIKELCEDAADYFAHQHVLYGPMLVTADTPNEDLIDLEAEIHDAFIAKLDNYLTAAL